MSLERRGGGSGALERLPTGIPSMVASSTTSSTVVVEEVVEEVHPVARRLSRATRVARVVSGMMRREVVEGAERRRGE